MYGIQDKINQILRGAETIRKNQSMLTAQSDSVELYNALCKATNEVARLREVCEWAADMMDGISPTRGQEIRDSLARLAPAPEEPTIKESLQVQPEWRELGPDEVIQEGDEEWWHKELGWRPATSSIGEKAGETLYLTRTRRPLPVQKEMPMEGDIEDLEEIANSESLPSSVAAIAAKTAYAIRYLRDEIQKLKQK